MKIKFEKFWFTDICIENKNDFLGYVPVIHNQEEENHFLYFKSYLADKFGEIHSMVFENSEPENPCVVKLSQWINRKKIEIFCQFYNNSQGTVNVSILVLDGELSKIKNLDLEKLKQHFQKIFKLREV